MICPYCKHSQSKVADTVQLKSSTLRYRKCSNPKCELNSGKKAKTFKTTESAIKMVEKK